MVLPMLFLFDLDGTLYRGNTPCPHAVESVNTLAKRGHAIGYLTNNSSKTVAEQTAKLSAMGFPCSNEQVTTSSLVAARLLGERGHRRILPVGEDGMRETLEEAGLSTDFEGVADAVLAGICRQIDYPTIDRALQHLLSGAEFWATNIDPTYPHEHGVQPGAGATVGAISGCSGQSPIAVGKPQPTMIAMAMRQHGIGPDETLVVGDRPDTDLEAGLAAGCRVHLVLTGIARQPSDQPWSDDLRGVVSTYG